LRPLEDKELIRVWDDTEIRPGSDWLGEISKAPFIREKELSVLLEAAENRGCLIFWISVSSSTFEDSPLARFQGAIPPSAPLDLMSDAEQSRVLTDIYRKMKAAVSVE
jgi:hypothetical protein